ncbi:glucose-6-phosphate dehydrogenase [Haploplasma axanthum]|uniref:Glucose-6-phosphate 1-dehydrogenase n=1 Tax=Haploplasma axanthum TaxID=29552 RepID=A0A449BD21_HAPAX|nr:hypothetical protein [Haploplasma axanthum]VEU80361.1 Glucose-6-phosphate 1-dehydrogenase [Haploplasma axanthum]
MKKEVIIVLYGSTGDLTFRKLLPAIIDSYKKEHINNNLLLVALGRRDFTTDAYLEFVKSHNEKLDIELLKNITEYYKMQITDKNDYVGLKELLDQNSSDKTRVIHYLAVSPELMIDVSNIISEQKIIEKNNLNQSVIFEKPFGSSYRTAHKINEELWKNFSEKQIYRIDHYLGKKMVDSILKLRFENDILKSVFSPKNLSSIEIVVKEKDGILNRGSFYDSTGAVKDMFQSHILQIVTLLTMKKPGKFDHETIINEKVKVLKQLKYQKETLVFGQYKGYLKETNVNENSLTETLLAVELFVNNKFKKVPIKVLTGKKLDAKETYIKMNLKDGSSLLLTVNPDSSLLLSTKILGENINNRYVFENIEDEYGKLILSAIAFEKEKFLRWDEIENSWRFVDELLTRKKELTIYSPNFREKE